MDSPQTDRFFRQFSSLVDGNEARFLMCYWARPKDQWQSLFDRDAPKITRQTKKQISLEIVETTADLYKKLPNADGLYVAGGDAEPLERHYPALKDLGKYLIGKVYLGSSMGAFMASKNYVLSLSDQEENVVKRGLGLIPVNCLCHWNVEAKKQMKLGLLAKHEPKMPILTLNEGEFVTFYQ